LAQAEILHVNEFEKTVTVKCGSKTQEIDVSDVTNFKDVLKELKPGTKIPVKTIKGHPYELNFQEPQLHPQRGDVKPAIEPPSEGTNRVNINHSARDGSQGIRPHGNPATDSVPSDARQLTNRPPLNPSP